MKIIRKIITKMAGLVLLTILMINFGMPLIQNTGTLIAKKFTSITDQAFDDIVSTNRTDVNVEMLSNEFDEIGDMTLTELFSSIKTLASSDTTTEELCELIGIKE